jgi:predicted TIM-barrel fold metal-dependent hydrolase
LMDRHSNLYLSTAFPGEKWDDGTEYPFPNYLRRIRALVDRLGTDRLMWATDWPWFEWRYYQKLRKRGSRLLSRRGRLP